MVGVLLQCWKRNNPGKLKYLVSVLYLSSIICKLTVDCSTGLLKSGFVMYVGLNFFLQKEPHQEIMFFN